MISSHRLKKFYKVKQEIYKEDHIQAHNKSAKEQRNRKKI